MVRHTADHDERRVVIPDQRCEIGVHTRSDRSSEKRFAVFHAEDQVSVELGERLGHAGVRMDDRSVSGKQGVRQAFSLRRRFRIRPGALPQATVMGGRWPAVVEDRGLIAVESPPQAVRWTPSRHSRYGEN